MKNCFIFLSIFLMASCSSGSKEESTTANTATTDVKATTSVQDEKKDSIKEKLAQQEDDYKPEILDPKNIPSPIVSIKNLDGTVENYHLGQALTPEQIEENRKLKQKIIRGTFDIQELCRLSLAKHWDTLSEDQRKYFVKLMTNLLEKKAILSKEQVKGGDKSYNIKYVSEKYSSPEKTKATVFTKLFIPKDRTDFDLTYEMLLTPYGWKIYDVIVDDASLLNNYKFQFGKIIEKNGFDDLIKRMETKLDAMK